MVLSQDILATTLQFCTCTNVSSQPCSFVHVQMAGEEPGNVAQMLLTRPTLNIIAFCGGASVEFQLSLLVAQTEPFILHSKEQSAASVIKLTLKDQLHDQP